MSKEKSAGAIIFRVEQKQPLYLLLHYPSSSKTKKDYWDLPKGHMEEGESEEQTARREVEEETGLREIELLDGFRELIHYWFQVEGKKVSKTVVFYLAETRQKEVEVSSEHIGFQWLSYGEAMRELTFQNAKQVLKKARAFLQRMSIV